MLKQPTTIRVGARTIAAEIDVLETVAEAREVLGTEPLLALINRAYRLQQLTALRRALERHPRGSGSASP